MTVSTTERSSGERDLPRPSAVRPRYRSIVAVDIEDSTSRTDSVKAELRRMLYGLLVRV